MLVTGPLDTIKNSKVKLRNEEGYPPNRQMLISAGRVLEENHTQLDYSLPNESILHLVYSLRGGSTLSVDAMSGDTITLTESLNTDEKKKAAI